MSAAQQPSQFRAARAIIDGVARDMGPAALHYARKHLEAMLNGLTGNETESVRMLWNGLLFERAGGGYEHKTFASNLGDIPALSDFLLGNG